MTSVYYSPGTHGLLSEILVLRGYNCSKLLADPQEGEGPGSVQFGFRRDAFKRLVGL